MLGPIFCLCFSLFGGNNQRNVFEQVARGNWTVDVMNTKTEEKLKGFTVEQEKWINDQLTLLFSSGVSHKELKSIAEVVKIHKPNVTNLSREGKRDKRVLKKWYYDNWKEIGEFLFNNLKIFDSDDKMINANAEIEYYKLKKESSSQ